MSKSKIELAQLFRCNDVINNSMKEIFVKSVKYYMDNNNLDILLISESIVPEGILEKIKNLFQDKFATLNVSVDIRYCLNMDIGKIIERYWNNIIYYMEKEIPSSTSWSKCLEYEIREDNLIIFPANSIMNYALINNEMQDKIMNKMNNELNIKINVIISPSRIQDNGQETIERTKKEEKRISIETLKDNTQKPNLNSLNEGKYKRQRYAYGDEIKEDPIKIKNITLDDGFATIMGEVLQIEIKEIKGNRKLAIFDLTDLTNTITVKVFLTDGKSKDFESNVVNGTNVIINGEVIFDNYSKCLVLILKGLNVLEKQTRQDLSETKRVELHLHTQMSSMDGINSFRELALRAKEWGHKAIAITDHGIVQGFPEAMETANDIGIKILYGVEGYLVNDKKFIVSNYEKGKKYEQYVVFDIETTGLSPLNDMIIEIGAVKIKHGVVIDRFSQLINPERPISDRIKGITGITDKMVFDKPTIEKVLPRFIEFMEDSVLVAHNASFDVSFIKNQLIKTGQKLINPVLDTLELSRILYPQLKNHKLSTIAKHLDVNLINHHRAVDDAEATSQIFLNSMQMLEKSGIDKFDSINELIKRGEGIKDESFHIIIFAKNLIGLKNLYKLISLSHLKYFYKRPRIPKSLLDDYRDGLIIGSACEAGELYRAILRNRDYDEIKNIANFYDYLEIQPIDNNMHLVRNGLVKTKEELIRINKQIFELGERLNKPVVATGDVHFIDPEDEIYRRILMFGQGYSDADLQPPLYFRTTEDMLNEFAYLGQEEAKKVVIDNTNLISDSINEIKPIPQGKYPPIIEGSGEKLRLMTLNRAIEIYGEPLPRIVGERLDKELNSIIKNGYAVMYIIAQELVSKSLRDGYLVGSRGSVGSSFVATMSGITEVNPLVPHYVCPNCKYSEFIDDGSIGSGIDLPEKNCPKCDSRLIKDGHDIPFEVFLGFEGEKEPDIDLNFAGEYQSYIHKYTEELFGEGYVYRAGTIGTIADKTAYGFVKKYYEANNINVHPAEINRLVRGCTGIKRTSGQHPGGVMIIPKNMEIYDFTPIQYPADDKSSGVITTHFDYHSISGRILKLDILGHDVPTIIRMLEEMTGIDAKKVPLDDKKTMDLFTSTRPLNIKSTNNMVGTLGIPEFGTKFVRQMLADTKPSTFAELVRISGLSHGTDVWLNNAQDLIRNKTATLKDVISTRDDIMLYLIYSGADKKRAFKIMEGVRKGKGLNDKDEQYLKDLGIPGWYIESCKKIKYMFPKAHAVAYVMMSYRIAYFKVYYPEAFYAAYFTTKTQDFDAHLVSEGPKAVSDRIKEIGNIPNQITAKERNQLTILEIVEEMHERGYRFQKVDLYKSDSDRFIIGKDGILPPLRSLEGVGDIAAKKIVEERKKGRFISIEDLISRTKISKTVVEVLDKHGCFNYLPQSNQISFFNI